MRNKWLADRNLEFGSKPYYGVAVVLVVAMITCCLTPFYEHNIAWPTVIVLMVGVLTWLCILDKKRETTTTRGVRTVDLMGDVDLVLQNPDVLKRMDQAATWSETMNILDEELKKREMWRHSTDGS